MGICPLVVIRPFLGHLFPPSSAVEGIKSVPSVRLIKPKPHAMALYGGKWSLTCVFNRGSNRGWAATQGKPLLLFWCSLSLRSHTLSLKRNTLVLLWGILVLVSIQKSLHQCPILINADQDTGIDPNVKGTTRGPAALQSHLNDSSLIELHQ